MDNKKLLLLLLLLLLLSLLLVSVSKTAHYSFKKGKKIQRFFRCKTRSLHIRVLSGTIETTITDTSHGCHIFRDHFVLGDLTYAVTAGKQILIKFSFMENLCRDSFEVPTNPHIDNFLNLVLFSLFSRSSPDNLSLCPHCNSRFLFIKDLLLFI